jgi:ABC-type glycerol-3-phosphate transport system substrate-binding protein
MLNPAENILDLTDWLAKNVKDKLIPESLLRAMAYAGRNYHLPVSGIVVRGFFYNKDVLQKAGVALPKSWDDFLKNVAPKIKAAGFTPVYGMGLDRWGMDFHMENYVADQFATTDIQDRLNKGQANLYDTQFLESLQMIKKLQDAGYFQDNVMTGTYDGAVAAISDGTTFMTGLSSPVGGRIPAAAQDKVSAFCLSKEGNRAYIALPQGMFVPKKAKNMDGARAYLDWFIKPENIAKYYGELKVSPPYQGVKVDMNLTSAGFKSFVDAEPAMDIRLKAFYGQAGNYAAQVLSGEKTPEEALAEMNATYIQNAKAQGLPVKEK